MNLPESAPRHCSYVPKLPDGREVTGWFDFPAVYDHLIRCCRWGGTIVEVGSWKGASFLYLASRARESGKRILCVSVDHGLGSHEHQSEVADAGGTIAPELTRNLLAAGLTSEVIQMVADSVMAARVFPALSVDAVFLDGAHDRASVEADIRAWWPAVRPGGLLCGHDWNWPEVQAAAAGLGAVQSSQHETCWEIRKAV